MSNGSLLIPKRQAEVVQEFGALKSWEERYQRLIDLGKKLTPLDDQFKTQDLLVKGCQSQVWLRASVNESGEVEFAADSDALIVRGLVAILLRVYSGAKPSEILSSNAEFIKDMGFASHLSPSRANGLQAMLRQIQYYALAFQALKSHRES